MQKNISCLMILQILSSTIMFYRKKNITSLNHVIKNICGWKRWNQWRFIWYYFQMFLPCKCKFYYFVYLAYIWNLLGNPKCFIFSQCLLLIVALTWTGHVHYMYSMFEVSWESSMCDRIWSWGPGYSSYAEVPGVGSIAKELLFHDQESRG